MSRVASQGIEPAGSAYVPHASATLTSERLTLIAFEVFGVITLADEAEEIAAYSGCTPGELWEQAVRSARSQVLTERERTLLERALGRAVGANAPITSTDVARSSGAVFAMLTA